ncbi:MAG: helix-turn-helix domain-containing protein [Giesbergeria sp.]|jgi:transcriptional regulator GlxA family with amidase domain|nr:helix-turn-helix domain-containing protein [Giesbergeria sp.]
MSSSSNTASLRVGILWSADSIASNAASVVDTLRTMNTLAAMRPGTPPLHWHWMALPGEESADLPPVPGSGPCEGVPDVIVLPGWIVATGPHLRAICERHSQHFNPVLHAHLARGGLLLALFNGAALLAGAGLLARRGVALPWPFAPSILLQTEGSIQWLRDRPWHRDGAIWTTASLQDTIPAFLDLLACTPQAELAQAAAHVLRFDPQRQRTATTAIETPTGAPTPAGALEQARRWLEAHRNEPYSLQATARAAATSPRTLLRWFAQVHGQTPQDYLHGLRIAQAQVLLQTTYLTVEDVAQQCGYADTASFRRIFRRHSGTTPGAYRKSFSLRTARKQWTGREVQPGA